MTNEQTTAPDEQEVDRLAKLIYCADNSRSRDVEADWQEAVKNQAAAIEAGERTEDIPGGNEYAYIIATAILEAGYASTPNKERRES